MLISKERGYVKGMESKSWKKSNKEIIEKDNKRWRKRYKKMMFATLR